MVSHDTPLSFRSPVAAASAPVYQFTGDPQPLLFSLYVAILCCSSSGWSCLPFPWELLQLLFTFFVANLCCFCLPFPGRSSAASVYLFPGYPLFLFTFSLANLCCICLPFLWRSFVAASSASADVSWRAREGVAVVGAPGGFGDSRPRLCCGQQTACARSPQGWDCRKQAQQISTHNKKT